MPRSTTGPEAAIEKLLAFAETTIGWSDENNTKKTPVHTWYEGKFGNPDPGKYAWDWCDGWVTYVTWQTGNELAAHTGAGQCDTQAHAQAFRSAREWTDGADGIRRGDVVFFDWGDGIEHVGLVVGDGPTGKISTIEGNTLNTVARRVRNRDDVAGYGRPKYGLGVTPTPPAPTTPPEVPVSGTVIFEKVYVGAPVSEDVKIVQRALNRFKPPVTVDGSFGPKTSAAYKAWQISLFGVGPDSDGKPGWTSMSRLAARYGFTLVRRADIPSTPTPNPTPTPPPSGSVDDYRTLPEPAHTYSRVGYGGKTVNVRTRTMLQTAARWANVSFSLTQGSYNSGVSASAGTHDGGGVVDIDVDDWGSATRSRVVVALRKAGFAAWLRTPAQGFSYHIHACAIGDREMSSGAKNQVQAYFNGRNGLANNGADDAPRHWPDWADQYDR